MTDPLTGIKMALDFCRSVVRVKDYAAILPLQEEAIAHQRALLEAQQSMIDLQRDKTALETKLANRDADPVRVINGLAWTQTGGPLCPNCWMVHEERRFLGKIHRNHYRKSGSHVTASVVCRTCQFSQGIMVNSPNPFEDREAEGTPYLEGP
ncbi:hypothetical protein [Phycisphaera mikurensis]|uniref:hypothetical protein n=1 Tax=Phycisphaera mikurensis TaxID=547188 RepID=UPI0012B58861|nr:hypothetical protein [Phycisphaera mikurensis]MBB6441970.1 hypothetical protein [Phycisphaera mikurensis]